MKKGFIDKTYKIKTERFSFLKKFSFRWLFLYLPVKSDILKNSQSLNKFDIYKNKNQGEEE